jgi:hypothetical protein
MSIVTTNQALDTLGNILDGGDYDSDYIFINEKQSNFSKLMADDITMNNNGGIISGNMLKELFGTIPKYYFDGTDYLEIPADSTYNLSNKIGIMFNINVSSLAASQYCIAKDNGTAGNSEFYLQILNTGAIWITLWDSGNRIDYTTFKLSSSTIIANTDYSLVFTYDGTTAFFYKNLVPLNYTITVGGTGFSSFLNTAQPLTIGAYGTGAAPMKATIDNFQLHNTYLTIDDIASFYVLSSKVPYYLSGAVPEAQVAGNFMFGKKYKIISVGTTDFTLIGASANNIGTEFIAKGLGTGDGTAVRTGNTINLAGQKTVSEWYDESGNVNNATQLTTSKQPKVIK